MAKNYFESGYSTDPAIEARRAKRTRAKHNRRPKRGRVLRELYHNPKAAIMLFAGIGTVTLSANVIRTHLGGQKAPKAVSWPAYHGAQHFPRTGEPYREVDANQAYPVRNKAGERVDISIGDFQSVVDYLKDVYPNMPDSEAQAMAMYADGQAARAEGETPEQFNASQMPSYRRLAFPRDLSGFGEYRSNYKSK